MRHLQALFHHALSGTAGRSSLVCCLARRVESATLLSPVASFQALRRKFALNFPVALCSVVGSRVPRQGLAFHFWVVLNCSCFELSGATSGSCSIAPSCLVGVHALPFHSAFSSYFFLGLVQRCGSKGAMDCHRLFWGRQRKFEVNLSIMAIRNLRWGVAVAVVLVCMFGIGEGSHVSLGTAVKQLSPV